MTDLRVDWCSHEAAKYAIMHWHYSKTMPVGKLAKFGVWESGSYIGAIVFGYSNNQHQGAAWGLTQFEACELLRVALTRHQSQVSQIVALALRFLCKQSPGLRLVLSYADPAHNHHGGIYQALNWTYIGTGGSTNAFRLIESGKLVHSRNVSPTGSKVNFGTSSRCYMPHEVESVDLLPKHKYLYPLDRAMRRQITPLAKPYPKRICGPSVESDTAGVQLAEAGAPPAGRSE